MQLETGAPTPSSSPLPPSLLRATRACWFHYKLSSCWFGTVFLYLERNPVLLRWENIPGSNSSVKSGMGLNCMLDKKRKKQKKQCTKKKNTFSNVWHVLLFLCYLDSHLSSCASCPFKGGGTLRVLRWAFFLYFFFFSRWDGVSVLFSCKRESLAFTFLFSSSVSRLRQEHVEGCTVCLQRMPLGASAHQSSQLLIWVQFTFIPSCTC